MRSKPLFLAISVVCDWRPSEDPGVFFKSFQQLVRMGVTCAPRRRRCIRQVVQKFIFHSPRFDNEQPVAATHTHAPLPNTTSFLVHGHQSIQTHFPISATSTTTRDPQPNRTHHPGPLHIDLMPKMPLVECRMVLFKIVQCLLCAKHNPETIANVLVQPAELFPYRS